MVKDLTPPNVLYARFQVLGYEPKDKSDVIGNITGNPKGDKRSWVPYIYAITEDVLHAENLEALYFLKVTFEWPATSKLADETADNASPQCYEVYKRKGYVGVKRAHKNHQTIVIFDPHYYISAVHDTGKQAILYNKCIAKDIKQSLYTPEQLPVVSNDTYQQSINSLLKTNIGMSFIDPRKDYFCVAEIARRKGISPQVVFTRLTKILERVSVNKSSGCWVSTSKKDYTTTYWLALGGLDFNSVFRFPHDLTQICTEPPVIKNSFILHHPICELTLKENHTKCCRPSHLRLGTSMENAYHIKIRQVIEQLFDFSPDQLMQYVHHINGLASLIQHQLCTATTAEADKIKKSKRHNRVTCITDLDGSRHTSITGNPHIGDTTETDFFDLKSKNVLYENTMANIARLQAHKK